MSDSRYNSEIDRVLKTGKKVAVEDINPDLRFTRLGHVLREHAVEEGTIGDLAHAILTYPYVPLQLTPLHALADALQDHPDHPLAARFNWHTLPTKVALDLAVHDRLLNKHGIFEPQVGNPEHRRIATEVAHEHGLEYGDAVDSVARLGHRWRNRVDWTHASKRGRERIENELVGRWLDPGGVGRTDAPDRY